jgi:hypothetical protein
VTVSVQHLTNTAYGFPRGKPRRVKPVALACLHITGNSRTAAMTDLHKAAQNERDYANRAGSNGPSAHNYVARDGWAIEAVGGGYAAWSNGDVSSPHTSNPGIRRVLAMRAKGYNANEAYWYEAECVGYGTAHPITAAQKHHLAERIAALAKASGLPINRETVHGHWEINGIDRQNCPCPPSQHESFLADIIGRANAILTPPVTYRLHVAHNAVVRTYTLAPTGCIRAGWTDEVWAGRASSAACTKQVHRITCNGKSGATTTRVTSGKYRGKTIRVGAGVTVTGGTA